MEAGVAWLSFISAAQTAEVGLLFSKGVPDLDDWPWERRADDSDLIKCGSSAARSLFLSPPSAAQLNSRWGVTFN